MDFITTESLMVYKLEESYCPKYKAHKTEPWTSFDNGA